MIYPQNPMIVMSFRETDALELPSYTVTTAQRSFGRIRFGKSARRFCETEK